MNPGITIEYKHPYHKLMKGIYKLTFGRLFYIGQTKRMAMRVYQHERAINNALRRYAMPHPFDSSYRQLARYLHENPLIRTGTIEVIQRSVTSWDLYYAENFYLQEFVGNPDCVNLAPRANKSFIDDDVWDIGRDKNGFLEYFDPRDPATRYGMYQKLRTTGEIAKRTETKKEKERIRQLLSFALSPDTKP